MSKVFVNIGLSLDGYMGRRLFENVQEGVSQFRIDRVVDTPDATHLRYVRA